MKISIKFDGKSMRTEDKNKQEIILKDPINEDNEHYSPTELLLIAMSGCSSSDVIVILEKMRKKINFFKVELEGERRDEDPKTLKTANFHYIIETDGTDENVERAVKLSLEKYCSVSILAKQGGADLIYSITHNGKKIVENRMA